MKKKFNFMGICLSVCLAPSMAEAAIIEQELPIQNLFLDTMITTGQTRVDQEASTTYTFTKFDQSIGVLNAVSVAVQYSYGFRTGVILNPGPPVTGRSVETLTAVNLWVEFPTMGFSSLEQFLQQHLFADDWYRTQGEHGFVVDFGPGDLSRFVGEGTLDMNMMLGLYQRLSDPDNLGATGRADASISGLLENSYVRITYDYTSVPEPTAMLLFGSSLLGLLGVGRKAQANKKSKEEDG